MNMMQNPGAADVMTLIAERRIMAVATTKNGRARRTRSRTRLRRALALPQRPSVSVLLSRTRMPKTISQTDHRDAVAIVMTYVHGNPAKRTPGHQIGTGQAGEMPRMGGH
jgi:hypothetical protein